MITMVSIALYACSVFFAANVGATAEQFKEGRSSKSQAALSVAFTVLPFLLAVILQVAA